VSQIAYLCSSHYLQAADRSFGLYTRDLLLLFGVECSDHSPGQSILEIVSILITSSTSVRQILTTLSRSTKR
jgi:hypothetical protein